MIFILKIKVSRNIPPQEIKKFIRDIEEQDSHGIFISQNSGITSKWIFILIFIKIIF